VGNHGGHHDFARGPKTKKEATPKLASLDCHERPRKPAQSGRDAARARRPTGALIPSVLNPGPLPLGPGIETRPTDRSQKAADMPRFWLGRSVAGRLLIRNQRKSGGERYPPKKDALVACGARP